jgi:GNAT superfamily N-acetyltransferase
MPIHSIRRAREQDCLEIARLTAQLGYPTLDDEIRQRLKRLLASPNDLVLVAESSERLLAGWTHAFLSQLLESDYRVEIGGLVVDKNFQRRGVGRELIRRIEQWAAEHKVRQISVRCKTTRLEAHQFYESLGYRPAKTQTAFRKSLN